MGMILHDDALSEEEDFSCRICLEPSTREEVIAPCSCKGSSKWVHRSCLDKWRSTREDKAFGKCMECLRSYTLISRVDDSYRPQLMRRAKFYFFVLRDLSIALLVIQLFIIGLSSAVSAADSKDHWLLRYFHSTAHKLFFYYFCGLILFLSILGMIFFCGLSSNHCGQSDNCADCCRYCGSDHSYRGSPYYFYDTPSLICVDCGGDCCCPGSFHHCCRVGLCDAGCCTGFSESACGACECTSISAELFPVIVVILVIFAFIGAVVAIFAGSLFIQRVISTHVHVLQKRGLASDFIVADLDAMDTESRSADCQHQRTSEPTDTDTIDIESNQLGHSSETMDRDSFFEIESSIRGAPFEHSESSNMLSHSSHDNSTDSHRTALTDEAYRHFQRDDEGFHTQYESNGVRRRQTPATRALSVTQRRDLENLGLI